MAAWSPNSYSSFTSQAAPHSFCTSVKAPVCELALCWAGYCWILIIYFLIKHIMELIQYGLRKPLCLTQPHTLSPLLTRLLPNRLLALSLSLALSLCLSHARTHSIKASKNLATQP